MPSFQFIFSLILFLISPQIARGAPANCTMAMCLAGGPQVRFPFRLRYFQKRRLCGYPGFDLSCNNRTNLTTLTLPGSGPFIVTRIDYDSQNVWISDLDNCLSKRLLAHPFTLDDTPFSHHRGSKNYTFLNCSSSSSSSQSTTSTTVLPDSYRRISCLSDSVSGAYAVYTVPSRTYYASAPAAVPPSSSSSSLNSSESCTVISTVLVPRGVAHEWEVNMAGDDIPGGVALTWSQPNCSVCEDVGKNCGWDTGRIVCSDGKKAKTQGLPRGAKYGIIIGVGIPGFLFLIAIANYIYSKIFGRRHHPSVEDPSASTVQISANVVVGLDAPTIESYPKTLLGESRRLPRANDNTCSICLGDYQPKEALRTIPECNHYFHANCIDEWLKLNATCPVCRKSPEGSSLVTPSSSVSSSSSSSLASMDAFNG